jgi:tetratricopeptide (TPR) repeat protein
MGVLALVLGLAGCGSDTARHDLSEMRNPLIRKARAKADQGDQAGALECLNQALLKKPDLAQAHLAAGLLYDDFQKDYVRAIYHYQRYLELCPAAEERAVIEERTRKARLSLAAAVSDQLPDFSEKFKALQEENNRLKNELRQARENAAPPGATSAVAALPPKPDDKGRHPDAAPAASNQIYRVQEHETLSMIARKVYQDPSKWKVIYEANRQTLASPEKLKPGQTLIIPR